MNHLLKKKKSNRSKKGSYRVTFLKERSPAVKHKISFISATASSKSNFCVSASNRKLARKNLKISLWFDQLPYKRYLTKLQKFVALTLNVDISNHISFIVRGFEELSLNQGYIKAIKEYKLLHDIYIRCISSNSFDIPPFWTLDADGYPNKLGILRQLMKGTINERRAGLHAIQVIKLVGAWEDTFSLDTITKSPPSEMIPINQLPKLGNYLTRRADVLQSNSSIDYKRLAKLFRETVIEMFPTEGKYDRLRDIIKLSDVHYSARGGPNGPALMTVVLDHDSIVRRSEFYNAIKEMAIFTKNRSLLNWITKFDDEPYIWVNSKNRKTIDSRLSIKDEAWTKRRIFAICDWFSQSSLKGLHKHLFKWLRSRQEDGTFDQDRVSSIVKDWSTGSGFPESADLSAATDSIPVEVQSEILSQIVSQKFAMLWRTICCDRDFEIPNSTDRIRYNTGQPMGILSSWAMLAVWHHSMVLTSMKYLGLERIEGQARFTIIGDDVAMLGTDLFRIYNELVSTMQGVGISKIKGYHSDTQNQQNPININDVRIKMTTAELAKRIFCGGYELTVIPSDELKSSFESPDQFPSLLYSLQKRGYPEIEVTSLPSLSSLCFHKKTALLLMTAPISMCPRRVTHLIPDMSPLLSLPWYQPWFDEDLFIQIFIKKLRDQLITVLARVLGMINQWISYSIQDQETKVKTWTYECVSQLELIRFTAQKLAGTVVESDYKCQLVLSRKDKYTIEDIHSIKEFLSELEVIFELEILLKERSPAKRRDKYYYTNKLMSKVIRETVKVVQERQAINIASPPRAP